MMIFWLSILIIPCYLLYLFMLDRRDNREKKEHDATIQRLKLDAGEDPERLRQIEIYEIANKLTGKIMNRLFAILGEEDSGDLYSGAFKNDKSDINKLAECLIEHGYQPDMFDEKVSNKLIELSQDTELSFLLKHGVRREAEIRQQLQNKN